MPEENAEPTVRAGFILIPETGDSTLMKVATKMPATHGVNRVKRRELDRFKTIETNRNEIVNSATKATHGPSAPGTVETNWTRASEGPRTVAETRTPVTPPANCAIA